MAKTKLYTPSTDRKLMAKKAKREEQLAKDMITIAEGGKCEAKTTRGTCSLAAGWGTNHLGRGRCKWHGGMLPNQRKHLLAAEARLMGCPIEMNPVEAMIWCIRITAGEIKWLSDQIAEIDQEEDWVENTVIGKQMNVFVRERTAAQHRLFKFSSEAVKLGLAERAIKLAEMYGETIAAFMHGVLDDIDLTPAQQQQAKVAVRRHLILLEGGRPIQKEDIEAVALSPAS